MTKLFIFDIDGTLADCSHRLHFIKEKPKNFKEFEAQCDKDVPIRWAIWLNRAVAEYSVGQGVIVILTGRHESMRIETEAWLDNNCVFYNQLLMRPNNVNEPDNIFKPKMLKEFIQGTDLEVQFILEDRARVCEAYRQAGFNVLQCAKGDY
jgi:hypothetical protein